MKNIAIILTFFVLFNVAGQVNEAAPWISTDDSIKKKTLLNLEEHSRLFNTYWKNKDKTKKGSGVKPFKRWENHWRLQLTKEGHLIKPSDIWKAWEQKQILKQSNISSWRSLGPYTTNVKYGQGRINTFIIDPNNPQVFYVGAPAGGIWKSYDSGANWTPLSDNLPQLGVSGIAIDPNNSNTIYISTGDDDARDTYSVGVLKSTDGGLNWNSTGLNFSSIYAVANEIYIHPDDSNTLWVSSNQGLFKSTDAGVSWSKKLSNNILDFKLKPGNPDVIYAVSKSKFYRSENGGNSFGLISEGLPSTSGRFAVDVSPDNPEVVYILSAKTDNSFQGVYKSDDSGLTFSKTKVTTDLFGGSTQAWYDMALTVNPDDADMVFVGVLDIWRSMDGGDSFEQKNRWWNPDEPSYTHADIHFLRYFNNKLYAGTDGGIYESSSNADSFTDLTEGLNISQYYRISTARSDASLIVGGLQDNGGFGFSQNLWHQYHSGDGMDCAIDPNDNNIYYGFSQYGGSLNVSYNAGQTEGGSLASAPDAETDLPDDHGGKWITPLLADKQGDLYAGYSRVYKLEDNQWQQISDPVFGGDLDHLKMAPSDNNIMYAARANKLFKSLDKGQSFEEVPYSFPTTISWVEINHLNENVIYVTTAGLSGQVLRSLDGGDNWEDLSANLPNEPKLVIRHQNQSLDNDLYLGTSIGIYHFNDQMTEWQRYDAGLPNSPVYDIEINIEDKLITAATYGRGVWQSPIKVQKAGLDLSLISINSNKTVQCNGIAPSITVKNNGLNNFERVEIEYQVDEQTFTYTYNGQIAPEELKVIELPSNNEVGQGDHKLRVEAKIDNDAFDDNNVLYGSFTTNSIGEGMYLNTFGDLNPDNWLTLTTGNETELWEKAIPESPGFKDKFDNAYVTNASGNYSHQTTAYLISPCYDLTRMENPELSFDMAFDIELNWDVLYLEYSVDKGKSWEILGSKNDPNWYNSDYINAQRPITVGAQWTGVDLQVKTYSYPLNDFNEEPNIIFRFVFASDQAESGQGAAIDNFTIGATAILAVDDLERHNFKLFPNPSTGLFFIQRQGFEEMHVSVYDITGKLILQDKNIILQNYTLDLMGAKSGLYFLKIIEGKNQLSTTILKK